MIHSTIDSSQSPTYEAQVSEWCDKFTALMKAEKHAAVAILGYYLPHLANMLGCPLDDAEFEELGIAMRHTPAMLAAAEKTGLFAEGISAIFFDALNNCGSWCYHYDNIRYIFSDSTLCKYVPFYDRYVAECLLSAGEELCYDDDAWYELFTEASNKLSARNMRGYA